MFKLRFVLAFILTGLLSACGNGEEKHTASTQSAKPLGQACGDPVLVDVQNAKGGSVGVFEIFNDGENLGLVFSPNMIHRVHRVFLYVGELEGIPQDTAGSLLPNAFPLKLVHRDAAIVWNHSIPLSELPKCFVVAVSLEIYSRDLRQPQPADLSLAQVQGNNKKGELSAVHYCVRRCGSVVEKCPNGTEPGQFRTHSQQRWGEILGKGLSEADFRTAFPQGLVLGCNQEVALTSAEAVVGILPASGVAGSFSASLTDPEELSNALAGEACALALALGYDRLDDDFSASPVALELLVVAGGPFKGWQVKDLLAEANSVLGGCASNYSAGQMEEVLRKVNMNFAEGDIDAGFLICPGG